MPMIIIIFIIIIMFMMVTIAILIILCSPPPNNKTACSEREQIGKYSEALTEALQVVMSSFSPLGGLVLVEKIGQKF